MRKNSLLYSILILSVLLWALNTVAINLYLYWTVGWYDIMMHFLGGLTIGVFVIWLFKLETRTNQNFLIVIVCVMVVGIAYEVFEYIYDLTLSTQEYPIDTTIDLVMDALGAFFAYRVTTSQSQ